jgi:ketosteroid isomerase-like protein
MKAAAVLLLIYLAAPIASAQKKAMPAAPRKPAAQAPARQGKPAESEKPKAASVITPGLPEQVAPEEIAKLVHTWLETWNKLDGSEALTQAFVALYTPDARHEVGPSQKPLGPEFFAAPAGIRKMAEDFAKANTEAAYRLETSTADEKGVEMIYFARGPWGGPAIAIPYTGAYTVRETKRRYFYPGVAVFHVRNGRIFYARFYGGRDELAEVKP